MKLEHDSVVGLTPDFQLPMRRRAAHTRGPIAAIDGDMPAGAVVLRLVVTLTGAAP